MDHCTHVFAMGVPFQIIRLGGVKPFSSADGYTSRIEQFLALGSGVPVPGRPRPEGLAGFGLTSHRA